jgi:hypothetical protein
MTFVYLARLHIQLLQYLHDKHVGFIVSPLKLFFIVLHGTILNHSPSFFDLNPEALHDLLVSQQRSQIITIPHYCEINLQLDS